MFNRLNTIIVTGLIILWRVYLCATVQLHQDEPYYWLWAKKLALSYYDHPPMAGYFIWITTLFSDSELAVRFSGVIVSVVLSIITWKLAVKMFNKDNIASAAVIILNILPLTMSGGIIMTPDTPAFLFWALSVYFAWLLVSEEKPVYWYLLGVSFGLGLVSKYTVVLFAPCFILFLLVTDSRKLLKSIHPYLAGVISFLVFLPVVIWNYQHQWISFKFQLGHGMGSTTYKISNLLEYFGGQLLVVTPFFWLLGAAVCIIVLFRKKKHELFLSLLSLPIILFFAYASLKKSGEANWPALSYFTMIILTAGYMMETGSKLKKNILIFCAVTAFLLSFLATLHLKFSVLPLAKFNKEWVRTDATNFFYGWKELADELSNDLSRPVVITHSHQLSAEVAYYTKLKSYAYIDENLTRFSQFNMDGFSKDMEGKNGYYVYADEMGVDAYKKAFESYVSSRTITVYRNGFPIRTYTIMQGNNCLYKSKPL